MENSYRSNHIRIIEVSMTHSKKITIALFIICTLIVSTVVRSEPYVTAEVGVGYGYPSLISFLLYDNDDNKIGATGRLATGYLWNLTDNFKIGLEAGVQPYHNIKYKQGAISITTKRWSLDALGVVDYCITKRFDVFAKLGAACMHQEYSVKLNGVGYYNGEKLYLSLNGKVFEPESRFTPKLVIGVGYNIQKNLNLNFLANQEFRNQKHLIPGVRSFLVGIKYSFS